MLEPVAGNHDIHPAIAIDVTHSARRHSGVMKVPGTNDRLMKIPGWVIPCEPLAIIYNQIVVSVAVLVRRDDVVSAALVGPHFPPGVSAGAERPGVEEV